MLRIFGLWSFYYPEQAKKKTGEKQELRHFFQCLGSKVNNTHQIGKLTFLTSKTKNEENTTE